MGGHAGTMLADVPWGEGGNSIVTTAGSTSQVALSIAQRIAEELGVRARQVTAAVDLLDGGATVPFIARYRKEVTGCSTTPSCARSRSGCATCASWRSAGPRSSSRSARRASSTTRCEAQILAADTKARLEDIYLPYKPKRRTKAQIAREAGLEPLADALLADPTLRPARPRRPATSTPSRAWPTPPPRSTAPGRSWSSASPRTPT